MTLELFVIRVSLNVNVSKQVCLAIRQVFMGGRGVWELV